MNYYERHLGDYSKDTRWLSTYQHGVYTLLLDWYYTNEKPIPLDLAFRIVQARSGPERKAAQEVITTFFDLDKEPGFAHNKRCDLDIAKYQVKCGSNSLKAKKRWDATGIPTAEPGQCPADAHQSPVPSPQKERAISSPTADGCPHSEIVNLYHESLPANPRIKTWTGGRQANLRTRWREDEKRQSIDYWERFFAEVAASRFLTGQTVGKDDRPFLPGLDWLVKPENFAKVIEGRYRDKP